MNRFILTFLLVATLPVLLLAQEDDPYETLGIPRRPERPRSNTYGELQKLYLDSYLRGFKSFYGIEADLDDRRSWLKIDRHLDTSLADIQRYFFLKGKLGDTTALAELSKKPGYYYMGTFVMKTWLAVEMPYDWKAYFENSNKVTIDGFLVSFLEYFMGKETKRKWTREVSEKLNDRIKEAEAQVEHYNTQVEALGYRSVLYFQEDKELIYALLMNSGSLPYGPYNNDLFGDNYFQFGGIFDEETKTLIEKDYAELQEYLDFFGLEDLPALLEYLKLEGPKTFPSVQPLLLERKKELEQALNVLGYDDPGQFLEKRGATKPNDARILHNLLKQQIEEESTLLRRQLTRVGACEESGELEGCVERYRSMAKPKGNYREALLAEADNGIWYSRAGDRYQAVLLEPEESEEVGHPITIRAVSVPDYPNTFIRIDIDASDTPMEVALQRIRGLFQSTTIEGGVEVVALVDAPSMRDRLDSQFPKRSLQFDFEKGRPAKIQRKLERKVKKTKAETLVILGRKEGRAFVERQDGKPVYSIAFEDLARLAAENKHEPGLWLVGSSMARIGSNGDFEGLSAYYEVSDLLAQPDASETLGGLLANYSSASRQLLIGETSFQEEGLVCIYVLEKEGSAPGKRIGAIYFVEP